jgi:hypothetical protein
MPQGSDPVASRTQLELLDLRLIDPLRWPGLIMDVSFRVLYLIFDQLLSWLVLPRGRARRIF